MPILQLTLCRQGSVSHADSMFELLLISAGRSATIVTAYLIFAQRLDLLAALELLRKARPAIQYASLVSIQSVP